MKVSIIIPIYNVEPYILLCLNSVANQTETKDVECILVDDRGNDKSVDLAESFIKDYRGDIDFHILHHEKNRGLSAARNTGVEASTGEYIFFLDSDDELSPDCLEAMRGIADKYQNVDMVQCAFYSKRLKKNSPYEYDTPEYTDDRQWIKNFYLGCLQGNIVMAQNRLVKRDFVIENHLYFYEGIIHEDNHWTFFLSKCLSSLAFCKRRVYFYRDTPGSITRSINVSREYKSFKTLVREFSNNIDPFLPGLQMDFTLSTLLCGLPYCTSDSEKNTIIAPFAKINNKPQRLLLYFYLSMKKSWLSGKVHNLLVRWYKLKDDKAIK